MRIFLKQCRTLASQGYNVTLVAQDGKGNEIIDGINIIDLGKPYTNRIWRILFSPWRVYSFLRSYSNCVIHFHDPELLPVAFLLKRNKRFVIYDSHEDYPRMILNKHWIPPVFRKIISVLFEMLENFIAKRLDAIVCATPFINKRFQQINPFSVDINNFPFEEEFRTAIIKKYKFSNTVCYVGGITRERGIIELIQALGILDGVTMIMCGSFESDAFAKELMSMPGWKFVDYRGIVNRSEVKRIMTCSSAGIVNFLPGPNHINSQPNKMFEYMSAGLPVISSNFPLWAEIIQKNKCGICINPLNSEEIAAAINWILQNPAKAVSMGKNGRAAVLEKYNWETESKKLIKVYEELLK